MRYVTIPKAATLTVSATQTIDYSLSMMLNEFVWCDPSFRSDANAAATEDRIAELFATAEEGAVVPVSDEDHELVTRYFASAPKWVPAHARALNRVVRAFTLAPSKAP